VEKKNAFGIFDVKKWGRAFITRVDDAFIEIA
jgi:hypothetical protein